jgi:ABC-type multidrug transport system ATPase subunit
VYKVIGVCPQFDILWEDLTIEEHLYFYARLKGVSSSKEKESVDASLAKVSLTTLRRRLTKTLSGGEKRRLSIAISLVGDPSVVFLDEPTVCVALFLFL